MIFPKNKSSHGLYQRILNDRKRQNLGQANTLIFETQHGARTDYIVQGKNIPRFLKLLIEKYGDHYLSWKDYPPKELSLLIDLMQVISESNPAEKTQKPSKDLERVVEPESQASEKQENFFAKYKINQERTYTLIDTIMLLFPGGKQGILGKKYYTSTYSYVFQNPKKFSDLIKEVPHGERKFKFIKGSNVPLLLQKLVKDYINWKDELDSDFVKDIVNYGLNGIKIIQPSEETILEEIRQLSPIIKHEVLAEAYGIQRSRVVAISSERNEDLKFVDRVAHSGDRLEYALELYRNNNSQRVRDIVREHVFNYTSNDLAGFASEKLEDYVTSWIGLYVEVFGYDNSIDQIKEKIKILSSKKVLELVLNELVNLEDLPQSVLDESLTITSWLDNKLKQYTSTLVPEELTNCFEEAINGLDEQEQEILRMRYGERLNMVKNGYKKPSFKDVGEALGIHEVVACTKESSAIEKLRQPELAPKIINFLGYLVQHFNNQTPELELVK